MTTATIATIDLDTPAKQRGALYWQAGTIRCRNESTGEDWDTETRCDAESDAPETIRASWGQPCWDLQWVES